MNPFISLCMIVKNEERVLKRCLDSIKDFVDEIIIADTGSTDSTKNIALKYTPNVYDFNWINDFSAARNFVQTKANGEWIIYLDADEYVEKENMNELIQHLRYLNELKKYDAFVVTQINFVGTLAGNVTQCPTIRIYRNDQTIHFERKIHEQLNKIGGEMSIGFLGLNIYHTGYLFSTFQDKNKNERNVSLITSELENVPNNGFDYFNLGNERLAEWKIEEALKAYQKAFKLKGSYNMMWVPMVVERIIFCLFELKKYREALDIIKDAIVQWPNAADFRSQRALIYFMQNRVEDAEEELHHLIQNRSKFSTVQSLTYIDYLPFYLLGRIYEHRNDLVKAVYNYSKALNFNDLDIDTLRQLYPILIRNESMENVIDFINGKESISEVKQAYILKILLDIGEVDLIERFLKIWRIVPSDGFKVKLNIGKRMFNLAKSKLMKKSMQEFLDEGWIDTYDILMLSLQLDNVEIFNQLIQCNNNDNISGLIALFTKDTLQDIEYLKTHIIMLLERCIKLKNFKLIDKVIPKVTNAGINSEIGDLLYKFGFDELAINFYQQLQDFSGLSEQTFINLMELFLKQGFEDDALQWAFTALENDNNDYKIYKTIINVLDNMGAHEDLEKIIKIALTEYPDSNYFKGYIM